MKTYSGYCEALKAKHDGEVFSIFPGACCDMTPDPVCVIVRNPDCFTQ